MAEAIAGTITNYNARLEAVKAELADARSKFAAERNFNHMMVMHASYAAQTQAQAQAQAQAQQEIVCSVRPRSTAAPKSGAERAHGAPATSQRPARAARARWQRAQAGAAERQRNSDCAA